jgi:glycerophosphoryl diester phosphodiesterase
MADQKSAFAYFSPAGTHVFAHRGFASESAPENTLVAFERALSAGATHIETDIQATSDGVAMVFHDDDLQRVAGIRARVDGINFAEISKVRLGHESIPTLLSALERFPDARFNIDIKRANAIEPTVKAILQAKAADRVLVSSFSGSRRRRAIRLLAEHGAIVATSADALLLLSLYLSSRLGLFSTFKYLSKGIQALQLPEQSLGMTLTHARFIKYAKRTGLQLDYWVINETSRMKQLVVLGADGIVTDVADVAVAAVRAE